LIFDWASLNGLEFLAKAKGKGQTRYSDLIRYGVSSDPSGEVVVERNLSRTIRNQGWLTGFDVAEASIQILFHVSKVNNMSVEYSLRPLVGGISAEQEQLEVQGSRYAFSATGALPRQGDAPSGIIPARLSGGALAAIPGALPDHVRLWVLNVPGTGVTAAVFDFTSTESRDVPLAQEGTNCSNNLQVTNISMAVRVGTLTLGTERLPLAVLEAAPHVSVVGITCLVLLGHSPPRQQAQQAPTKPIR